LNQMSVKASSVNPVGRTKAIEESIQRQG